MILQGQDGELRIIEYGDSGTTYYLEVLFCEMDFNGLTTRPRPDEKLILIRDKMDENAFYSLDSDEKRYAPFPISFSCRIADTVNTRQLIDIVSGASLVSSIVGDIELHSWKGKTSIDGNALPEFAEDDYSVLPMAYRVECLWDGAKNFGERYEEVHFSNTDLNITENYDGLMLNLIGMVYGDVSRITDFMSGVTILPWQAGGGFVLWDGDADRVEWDDVDDKKIVWG